MISDEEEDEYICYNWKGVIYDCDKNGKLLDTERNRQNERNICP